MYATLNRALRDENRQATKPFFLYIRLLMSGYKKLPIYDGKVYRGVPQDLVDDYPVSEDETDHIFWWGCSSTTTNMKILYTPQFFGTTGDRTMFIIDQSIGRSIKEYSAVASESEILLPPGIELKITANFKIPGAEDVTMIHLAVVGTDLVPLL